MDNYFAAYHIPVSFAPPQATVKARYYELSRQYHPDRYAQAGAAEQAKALRMAAINNQAYKTLRSADATMAYILKLNGLLEDEEKYTLPNIFLMEMMDINEAISDYDMDANKDALTSATNMLSEQLELWDDATRLLTASFENGDTSQELLLKIKDQYFRKKYLLRIKERIDSFATP